MSSLSLFFLLDPLQNMNGHFPVLLQEVLGFLPGDKNSEGHFLDVTAGGGGHFFSVLEERPRWEGLCWDKDPAAEERLRSQIAQKNLLTRAAFLSKTFGEQAAVGTPYDFILADLGVSSFQLDDRSRGMSLHSEMPPDFRMDPRVGVDFRTWLRERSVDELTFYFEEYGEEPRARKLAASIKNWGDESFASGRVFAERIASTLAYRSPSRVHPATRAFQALRMAINDELGELRRFLAWAPNSLAAGGRLAIISFHSVEDRAVKNALKALASDKAFDILVKKPIEASASELSNNPRSRSAKLRVLERVRS